jgi:hypothetical protein
LTDNGRWNGGEAMDGIYFYWFAWIGWVFCTFILPKSKIRTAMAFFCILILFLSNSNLSIAGLEVKASYFIVLLYSYFFLGRLTFKSFWYYLIISFVITLSYVTFYIYALFDPAWLILDWKWMLAAIIFLLSFFLVSDPLYRIVTLVVGMCHGDVVYKLLIQNLNPDMKIGSFPFLDVVSICVMVAFATYLFEHLTININLLMNKMIGSKKGYSK